MIVYAVAVLLAILLYGARLELGLFSVAGVLAAFGVYCMLLPRFTVRSLLERARQQVASSISRHYLSAIYPLGSDEAGGGKTPPVDSSDDVFSSLGKLQDVMQTTNKTTDSVLNPRAVLGAIASQAVPFLGFLARYIPHQWLPIG
jgi:hypothetical protein